MTLLKVDVGGCLDGGSCVKQEKTFLRCQCYSITKEIPGAQRVERILESSDTEVATCLCVGLTLPGADGFILSC